MCMYSVWLCSQCFLVASESVTEVNSVMTVSQVLLNSALSWLTDRHFSKDIWSTKRFSHSILFRLFHLAAFISRFYVDCKHAMVQFLASDSRLFHVWAVLSGKSWLAKGAAGAQIDAVQLVMENQTRVARGSSQVMQNLVDQTSICKFDKVCPSSVNFDFLGSDNDDGCFVSC